jgi:hypothetical protein
MVSWRHRSCKIQASTELLQMKLQTAEACSTNLWISSIVPWSIVSSQIYLVRRRYGFPTNQSAREKEKCQYHSTWKLMELTAMFAIDNRTHIAIAATHQNQRLIRFQIPIQIPASTYLVHYTPASLTPISSTRWSSKTSSNSYHFNCWLVMWNQQWSHGYN